MSFMSHRQIKFALLIAGFLLLACFGSARAGFNEQINYQGKLTDTSDTAVADGQYNMRFRLCADADCNTAAWTETRCYSPDNGTTCDGTGTNQMVTATSGLFSVLLGEVASLSSVDFSNTLFLEVSVGGVSTTAPSWEVLTPRKKLGAVPAAFEAKQLNGKAESSFGVLSENEIITGAWTVSNTLSVIATSSSALLTITQNGSGYGALISGGNVGIGTTTPGYLLTVDGGGYFTGTVTTTDLTVSGNSSLGTITAGTWNGTVIGAQYGGTGQNSSAWSGFVKVTAGTWATSSVSLTADVTGVLPFANGGTGTSTFSSGAILFGTSTYLAQDPTNLFWDDANNRLGVASSTPGYPLAVTGNVGVTGNVYTQSGSVAAPAHSFTSDNTSGMYLVSGGIGFAAGGGLKLTLYSTAGGNFASFAQNMQAPIIGINSFFGDNLSFREIASDGAHATLGAASSYSNISFVAGAGRNDNYAHGAQTHPTVFIHSTARAASTTAEWIGLSYQGTMTGTGAAGGYGLINTGIGNLVLNPNGGKVGVGTTSPYSQLEVYSGTASSSLTITAADATNDAQIVFRNGAAPAEKFVMGVDNTDDYFKITSLTLGTSDYLVIDTSGNVGINSSTPAQKLAVGGNIGLTGSIFSTATGTTSTIAGGLNVGAGAIVYDNGSYITSISSLETGSMVFDDDAGQVTWIDMPVSTASAVSTVLSYTAMLDNNPMITVYGVADDSGGVATTSVIIGSSTYFGTVGNYKLKIDSGSSSGAGIGVNGYVVATSYISGTSTLDLAEAYPVDPYCADRGDCPEVGDAVCAQETSSSAFVVEKCVASSTKKIIGVVSGNPGMTLGGGSFSRDGVLATTSRAVALAGRVEIKVDVSSSTIVAGDYITVSAVPGVAVKAKEPGRVIGMALNSFNGTDGAKSGTVTVFVNPHWYVGDLTDEEINDELPADFTSIILDNFTLAVKNSLRKLGLVIKNGTAKVRELIAGRMRTDELCIGDTCIGEQQLQNMLLGETVQATPAPEIQADVPEPSLPPLDPESQPALPDEIVTTTPDLQTASSTEISAPETEETTSSTEDIP